MVLPSFPGEAPSFSLGECETPSLGKKPQGQKGTAGQTGVLLLPQAQEACGPLEIDSALGLVQSLERDLQEAKAAARDGKLKPLPGETVRGEERGEGFSGAMAGGGLWRLPGPS